MAKFEQYTYHECLNAISLNALPQYMRVTHKTTEEILLLRFLTGTIDIKNTLSGKITSQRVNYTKLDFEKNQRISKKTIYDIFKQKHINNKKVDNYYHESFKYGNKMFFKNLLLELSNYSYQKDHNSNALAFLHLYRSVELLSYCFPLYFASKSTSYEKTFNILKDYFNKIEGGELKFFQKFTHDHLFKHEPQILDSHLKIPVSAPINDLQEKYYNGIKKLCDNNKKIDVIGSTPFSEIIITRRGLTHLIFDLRNRYFHLLTGDFNDNFSSGDIPEVNYFYSNVNEQILNWLSYIYIEILTNSIEN